MTENESLTDLLLVETSRRNTDLISGIVMQKPFLFNELMDIYLKNEEPVSRRAVWVVDTITEKIPELLNPYIETIIHALPSFTHDGMRRNSLRMLSRAEFPSDSKGMLINICFDWLVAPGESIAVKVYAMDILYRISKEEPELKKELADSIEWRIHEGSTGFQNHGRKMLKKLHKEMNSGRFK
jgi:hypothetical protein